MTVSDKFSAAVRDRDLDAVTALFAEDIRFFSPVKFRPFEGIAAVRALFRVLLRTFEDFRYVGEFTGTVHEDGDGESHVLVFRAAVGDKQIHGIDMIQLDESGLISKFTVMVRPQSAAAALSEAVLAGLVADGVLPAQA
jgi:hypothetical protein